MADPRPHKSRHTQPEDSFTKEKQIFIQKIEFLEIENEELRNREASLNKINRSLLDSLHSNINIDSKILLEILSLEVGKDIPTVIKRYQKELKQLRDELTRKEGELLRTQAVKEEVVRSRVSERKSKEGDRETNLKESQVLFQSKQQFSVLNSPSVSTSFNFGRSVSHRRRNSERVYEMSFREVDHNERLISDLLREKEKIEMEMENYQRRSNENTEPPEEKIVYIVKSKSKREEPQRQEKFLTPRYLKRYC